MKSLLLDTSAYSSIGRGNKIISDILNNAEQIFVPSIVVGELKAGFAFGTKRVENEKFLNRFLADPAVSVVTISDKTPTEFAEIYLQLRNDGLPIGQNDLWIAAIARENGLPLLTLDKDFANVKGIDLVSII